MQAFIAQLQLLLAALSAFLPMLPEKKRADATHIFDALGVALTVSATASANFEDLAIKLKALRAEIEAMGDQPANIEAIESAFARLREASASFRAAISV